MIVANTFGPRAGRRPAQTTRVGKNENWKMEQGKNHGSNYINEKTRQRDPGQDANGFSEKDEPVSHINTPLAASKQLHIITELAVVALAVLR